MSEPSQTQPDQARIHYIIAVHGIGNQRKNETILPVIGQIATARHNSIKLNANVLALGSLTSQSDEHGWIEFDDIPKDAATPLKNTTCWVPELADPANGENLRFVDFCWSGVMHQQYGLVGEKTENWSGTLINKLLLRTELRGPDTLWIVFLMQTLRKAILYIEFLMKLKIPKLSNEVFGEFLGDVELYGNFPHTRGRAVRLFHQTMSDLHQEHRNEFGDEIDPYYTIIAHSLGTVMSLDAITYAFANKQSRHSETSSKADNVVHFPGYKQNKLNADPSPVDLPESNWVQYLENFVTLGSPIDKFLALWTENYTHFTNNKWLDMKRVNARLSKIRHFNYSDEQDPVGHELDILISTPVWQALMEKGEDVVFARYPKLGIAHLNYWQDSALFKRILGLAIDRRDPNDPELKVEWYERKAYYNGLIISYLLIPSLGWLISTLALTAFWLTPKDFEHLFSWFSSLTIFAATVYLTYKIMSLIIMWRIQLVISRNQKSPMENLPERAASRRIVRMVINISPFVWAALTFLCITNILAIPLFFKIGTGMALLVSAYIFKIHRYTTFKWNQLKPTKKPESSQPIFFEYLLQKFPGK